MLEQTGFLDDDFYFSCEDVDMAWRAFWSGWKTIYAPQAVVYHKLKASGGNVIASYYDGRNYLLILWKNYPTSLLRRYWKDLIHAQLTITAKALRAFRGPEARARLRGQLAGLLAFPRMLSARRNIQANRRVPDEALTDVLTPVDGTTQDSYDPKAV